MQNAGAGDLSSWAVIFRPATIGGTVLPPDSAPFQTYLVQVDPPPQVQATPEPKYLALLLAGLVAMLWPRRRCWSCALSGSDAIHPKNVACSAPANHLAPPSCPRHPPLPPTSNTH